MVLKHTKNDSSPPDKANGRSQTSRANSPLSRVISFFQFDPVSLVSDIWDATDSWRATRRWRPLIASMPLLILFVVMGGTIAWGKMVTSKSLVGRYVTKAEEIAPINEAGVERKKGSATPAGMNADRGSPASNSLNTSLLANSGGSDSNSADEAAQLEQRQRDEVERARAARFADVLFRRVLQLESDNRRARYYVADRMSRYGAREQARSMMDRLAPADGKFYEPAHAWVARDMLEQYFAKKDIDRALLNHHLSIAADLQGTSPYLLSAYSQILESEKKTREAIGMMQRAANRDPAFSLQLATLFARYKQPTQSREAAERAIQYFSQSFGKKDEPDSDRIYVAEAYLQMQKLDEAIKVLQQGLGVRPDRPALRRALSSVYRLAYRQKLTRSATGQVQADLRLLNAALAIDPTNPELGEEIAFLQPMGIKANPDIIQALQKQLAAGGASAVTHLLLGNAYFAKSNIDKAITHWELAIGQDPKMVLAMNNLALGLASKDNPDFDRAMELIEKALTIAKDNPEILDSKGEILTKKGNFKDAIPLFERSIQLSPIRVQSRTKLALAYQEIQMDELANKQFEIIEKINAQIKASRDEAEREYKQKVEAERAIEEANAREEEQKKKDEDASAVEKTSDDELAPESSAESSDANGAKQDVQPSP